MLTCFQFKDMNVLEHGKSVAEWYADFWDYCRKFDWRLPEWWNDPRIRANLLPFDIMQTYQTYHDCGKPFCREVDAEGKQHFPNHAEHSYRRWLECANDSKESRQIAELIRLDMAIHTMKSADEAAEFAKRKEAISLLITGLCEIHSNAQMFGGIESTSFKIKWKQIDKIGKRILSALT